TLGPRGWVNPRPFNDRERANPLNPVAQFKESEPLRELAFPFLKPREGPPLHADAFRPLLSGQVGHRTLGRAAVLAVLSSFCLGLAGAGWWLGRRGGLSHLGWIGPASALAATLVIGTLGYQNRSQVPPTVAVGQ